MISRCETCGSTNVVSIQVQLADESTVEMQSCHKCEAKVWKAPHGRISLREVLDLASAKPPR